MSYSVNRKNKTFRTTGADNRNSPDSTHILAPDLSNVGIPDYSTHRGAIDTKYWKVPNSGQDITEMDEGEKTEEDERLAAQHEEDLKEEYKLLVELDKLFKAFARIMLDEINLLRAEHSLAPRTITQLKTAIRNQIDNE